MKHQHIKWVMGMAVAATLFTSSSCKKILDLQPHNSTFTEAYFSTGQDANTAIAGAYALLRKVLLTNNSWHIYGDLPAGELDASGDAFHSEIANGRFIGLNVGSENWNWAAYYQLMQQINLVINKVPGIPIETFTNQDEKAQIIGEAYFLRAFTYFYMSRIWGDVPLKLEPDLDISQAVNIPRTPAAAVLAQCLADCDQAEHGLVFGYDNDPSQTAVRANKGAVLALKAHIQAWKGDYAAAEKSADSVITYGKYQLVDSANYDQIFIGKSTEGIFEINVNYSQSEGQAVLNTNADWPTLALPYINYRDKPSWAVNKAYRNKVYRNQDTLSDLRYKTFYYKDQTIKYSNIIYVDGSKKNDPRLSNNLNIFRLTDIILLRAEALDTLHRTAEAVELLNSVRERAHAPLYDPSNPGIETDPLNILILRERLKELFYEGQSFYDLVRTGKLPEFNENFSGAQFVNGGWMWPVDPGMFKDDFTLTQTPYWKGRL